MANNYKSGFEKSGALQLSSARIPFEYEPGELLYKLKLSKAMCKMCGSGHVVVTRKYIPDFVIVKRIVLEYKGKFTSEMRTKMLAVIESNPDYDIRMVFMRNNWLTRTKKRRYTDWCEQHGIPCAVGEIPKEWIKEFKKLTKPRGIDGKLKRGGIE